jgi:hypothetical protein
MKTVDIRRASDYEVNLGLLRLFIISSGSSVLMNESNILHLKQCYIYLSRSICAGLYMCVNSNFFMKLLNKMKMFAKKK